MILKETLASIIEDQKNLLDDKGIERELKLQIDIKTPLVKVITGIRRCGKSTLLKQLIQDKCHYFNFEDPKAVNFQLEDFEKLMELFGDGTYFFDEIQNIPKWEIFIRKMHDSGRKFYITGSNASLLSREPGTRLTGRYIPYELFPFSYQEYLKFTGRKEGERSLKQYLSEGGMPGYLRYKNPDMLSELFLNIINRDIIVRHGVKDSKQITQLALFILTNIGKELSFNKIAKMLGFGSTNTVSAYISYFEDAYLLFTIPKFDYSYKKQIISPKKIYCIDTGLQKSNTASFSQDAGRLLENSVFLHLRRKHKDIFYYKGDNECDFIVSEKGKAALAIQVCQQVNEENREREIKGLKEAMKRLKTGGIIITQDQEDKIGDIRLIPAWKYFLK